MNRGTEPPHKPRYTQSFVGIVVPRSRLPTTQPLSKPTPHTLVTTPERKNRVLGHGAYDATVLYQSIELRYLDLSCCGFCTHFHAQVIGFRWQDCTQNKAELLSSTSINATSNIPASYISHNADDLFIPVLQYDTICGTTSYLLNSPFGVAHVVLQSPELVSQSLCYFGALVVDLVIGLSTRVKPHGMCPMGFLI